MSKRSATFVVVLGSFVTSHVALAADTALAGSGQAAPNVIIVFTDDQGYGDLSCHGNPILKTPNIDKLSQESLRFSNFHVAPVCTPSRGELMTGLNAMRNKACMVPAGRNLLRRDVPTMAEMFRDNGYATGIFGKWHLGDNYPYRPMDRGFQKCVWHKGWGLASEIEYDNDYYYTRYLDDHDVKYSDRYCANLWFDQAIEWMGSRVAAGEPFLTYIALNTPHGPFHALEDDYALYADKVNDPDTAHFFGMIHNIDQNVARLDRWLDEKQIRDNTILIYMNDNGTSQGETVFNAGMRGKKGSNYEGGHRAICFIRWPDGDFGPRTVAHPSHITDILPTLADLCELKLPNEAAFDGVSLQHVLRNEDATPGDRMIIVQYGGRQRPSAYFSCVVWNDWRLVGKDELYDLSVDPGQTKNIAGQHPNIAAKMKAHYDRFWAEVAPSVDVIEPIVVGSAHQPVVVLTSNNWPEVDVDNRDRIAAAAGPSQGGVWHIEAQQSGRYKVELSRWPFHLERGLSKRGPAETIGGKQINPGRAPPIAKAALSINGRAPIAAEPTASKTTVEFEIDLHKGQSTLQGWFQDASGQDVCGAYYGRITKI